MYTLANEWRETYILHPLHWSELQIVSTKHRLVVVGIISCVVQRPSREPFGIEMNEEGRYSRALLGITEPGDSCDEEILLLVGKDRATHDSLRGKEEEELGHEILILAKQPV